MQAIWGWFNDIVRSRVLSTVDFVDDGAMVDSYDKMVARWRNVGRLAVWTGASDQTIFGEPQVNWLARAWHDGIHAVIGADFTPNGERATMQEQQRQLRTMGLRKDRLTLACKIVESEVIGQVDYLVRTGSFPVDQRLFAVQFVGGY